ncbi:MAG: MerR family transcriptional regulator [Alphaproteobacteria bacterium]|jgi:DNA-binding transcriptional MerR regulator|nr:MerR family transcriptional regulator [Alphaproteobacteria bacterium]MBP9777199.1 MerR family transcriptional regulator [Alphaproteobacteria bacterium]
MTQWYVNELSKLTKVTVRTLHHYDKIGLLKPSLRRSNGYRLYSEADLLKLQQIIALKFFGFELSRIKLLMQEEINIFDHFRAQQSFLEQQVKSLQVASQTLEAILCESSPNTSVPWKTIIKLIKDYQMTKELKYAWVAKALNPTELKEYASFEQGLETRFTEEEAEASRQEWLDLVKEIEANLDKDPTSNFGVDMGKRCMDWVNAVFPKENAALRATLWEKGFKGGFTEVPSEVVAWLDKATSEYHKRRIYAILDQMSILSSDALLKLWNDILSEICGDDQAHKDAVYEAILADDKVSEVAKNWLKKLRKS